MRINARRPLRCPGSGNPLFFFVMMLMVPEFPVAVDATYQCVCGRSYVRPDTVERNERVMYQLLPISAASKVRLAA